MNKVLALVVFVGLSSLPMMAQGTSKAEQDVSKVEVFGGYQYTHLGSSISTDSTANGWDGSVTYNISKVIGITGDFNGAYQTVSGSSVGVSGNFPFHLYSYAAGPVFSFNSHGKAKPFVHVMFGAASLTGSSSASGATVSVTSNGLTSIFGGGVDMNLSKHVALRLFQADWVYYHFGLLGATASSAGNFKVATGFVFKFGG